MTMGLVGRKCGMTRVFTEDGVSVPVTVVEITPNHVTQLKTEAVDGYQAVQVTTGTRRAVRVAKAQKGHFAKAKVEAGRGMWEFRVDTLPELEVGAAVDASHFKAGDMVKVTAQSKGKGFAGVIKRHNFKSQDATHGNSLAHNAPGSIGQNQSPGKVFKGKKMAGHMGATRVTVKNLEVFRVDVERNALLIKGAIPGCIGTDVVIRSAK